jgi:hypothetical protein
MFYRRIASPLSSIPIGRRSCTATASNNRNNPNIFVLKGKTIASSSFVDETETETSQTLMGHDDDTIELKECHQQAPLVVSNHSLSSLQHHETILKTRKEIMIQFIHDTIIQFRQELHICQNELNDMMNELTTTTDEWKHYFIMAKEDTCCEDKATCYHTLYQHKLSYLQKRNDLIQISIIELKDLLQSIERDNATEQQICDLEHTFQKILVKN